MPEERETRNSGAVCYHVFVAVLLLLLGCAFVGTGAWLRNSARGGPSRLKYADRGSGDGGASAASAGAIGVGVSILATGVASLIALARRCVGKMFRVVYVLCALAVLALLVFMASVSLFIVSTRKSTIVRNNLSKAWQLTVFDEPDAVCEIEKALECRSFEDNTCVAERCATCPAAKPDPRRACFSEIKRDLLRVYLPVSIVSFIAGLLVLVDLVVTCAF